MTNKSKTLSSTDFENAFNDQLSGLVKGKIDSLSLEYVTPSKSERDNLIRRSVDVLLDQSISSAGEHRHEDWETGWAENLSEYNSTKSSDSINPKYFGKYQAIRWLQDYIIPKSDNFEANTLSAIEYWLFDKYFKNANHIYEFGCGTGHNLVRTRQFNDHAQLWGLDWAKSSQEILNSMANKNDDSKLHAANFDFFNPNYNFKIQKNNVVMTVAALEQVGTNFKAFVKYLTDSDAELCVHIEPIYELLDPSNLLDYLSIRYFQKRNYLWGLLNHLKDLEKHGKVQIIEAKRSYIGSMFIDGYSVVVWKNLKQ